MRSKHSIQDLLHQFQIPDQATWWQKVEKEIGENSPALSIESDLGILPLQAKTYNREPIIWNSSQDWKIVEAIDISLFEQEKDLRAFEIDEIILQMWSEADIRRFPYQDTSGTLSGRIPAPLVNQALAEPGLGSSFVQVVPLDDSCRLSLENSSPSFHWRYASIPTGSKPSQRLTYFLDQIHQYLCENPTHVEHWRINVEISDAFYAQIAELRALKILLLNLLQAFHLDLKAHPKVYAIIRADDTRDLYSNLIRSTSQALSAILGGIDALCFETDPASGVATKEANEYRRLSRNIHYILKHEAHLNHRLDPLNGSQYIEAYTEALAYKAWTNLGGMDPRRASNNY